MVAVGLALAAAGFAGKSLLFDLEFIVGFWSLLYAINKWNDVRETMFLSIVVFMDLACF